MASGREREWEIDYDEVFKQKSTESFWCCLCAGGPMVFIVPTPLICCPFYYVCTKPILRKQTYTQKLKTTEHDIQFEAGPMWGAPAAPAWMTCNVPQCWRGKITKTVPFDRVQDVVIQEKGGKFCCCYDTKVDFIGVQTASGGGAKGVPMYEVSVLGLKDAHGFRDHVLSKKRSNKGEGVVTSQPSAGGSAADRLRALKAMHDDGLITNREFEEKREVLMAQL